MEHIDRFISILSRQLELNKKLLRLAKEKREAIMSDDAKRLGQMIIDEQAIVKEMISLEKERASQTSRIGRGEGVRKVEDIKSLIGKTSEEKMEQVDVIAKELREVLLELEEKNSLNQSLMQFSLDYIDVKVNLMTQRSEPLSYSSGKGASPQAGAGRFDSKY